MNVTQQALHLENLTCEVGVGKRFVKWHESPSLPFVIRGLIFHTLKRSNSTPRYLSNQNIGSVQLSSFTQLCPILWDPMDCSMPGFPVHQELLEFTQTHVHQVDDAIQPSHLLSPASPPAFNLSQHERLFQWVGSSHQVAKVLEFQHQSFQWIFRTDFL